MAKGKKPVGSKKGKRLDERFQNRLKDMYPSQENLPASISIRQADELRARVAELEVELTRKQSAVITNTSTTDQDENSKTPAAEPASVVDQSLKNQPPRSTWLAHQSNELNTPPTPEPSKPAPHRLTTKTQTGRALSFTARYAIFGALFGLAFPVFSLGVVWWMHTLPATLASVTEAHHLNSLLWVIDTAPFFLGLFALFIGQREDRLRRVLANLNEVQARQGISADLLQQRVRDLALAVEVSHAVSERTADLHNLLRTATELVCERFNLYYTQIYLTDPTRHTLVLRAGTGEVGAELLRRGHRLLVGSGSINGRAAAERRAVIVADTSQSADFLPNPLLPSTHSEMAIPLIAGGDVVGVLDVQSEQPGALNENNLLAFEALAGQLAIAIQNVALSTEAEHARSEMEVQVRRLTERGWQEFLDAIERGQKIGFAFDQTDIVPLKADALSLPPDEALSVPISVTGTQIGAIQLAHEPDRAWTADETGLIQATAVQLAQHIENLRLMAEAEKYRAEAEDAVRRLTREGWDEYLQADGKETAGFAYDLNEVHPLSERGNSYPSETTRPLAVRNEIVGELSINTGEGSQAGANELLSAVASQLSAHIENLRLSLSNMSLLKSTEARAQREQTLRQITSALRSSTNPATIMRTAVSELGNILGRKTVVQLSTPERTDQAASTVQDANDSDIPAN